MAQQATIITKFTGGISPHEKAGYPGSVRNIKGINIHDDPNFMIPLPKPSKQSGSTVVDLIKFGADTTPFATDHYFIDGSGNIYKETSGGTWTVDRSGATIGDSGTGQGIGVFDDYLYYASATTIGRKGKLSASGGYTDNFFGDGTLNAEFNNYPTATATYALTNTISEDIGKFQAFVPYQTPITAILVGVSDKGSGNWTLTLHDINNVSLGSVTLNNVNVPASGYVTFTFSTPIKIIPGYTLHFHVTTSNGTGQSTVFTSGNFSTSKFKETFQVLISDSQYHPISNIFNGMAVGNSNFIGFWDGSVYRPCRVPLAAGFRVRNFFKFNEFLGAVCWKGTDIDNTLEGRIYMWDGISTNYNYYYPISGMMINCATEFKNRVFSVVGNQGNLYLGVEPFQLIQHFPSLKSSKTTEVAPAAITDWRQKVYFGFSLNTDDADFIQGIYSFGNQDDGEPEVLNYEFPISTGTTTGTGMKIGMVKSFGKYLYWSWKDGSSYGVDRVAMSDNPQQSGLWESLIIDNDNPLKTKLALKVKINFLPLTSGQTITPKYKIDRATNFTNGATVSTVGETQAEVVINTKYKEFEFGFDWTTGTDEPKITAIYFEFDDLSNERADA